MSDQVDCTATFEYEGRFLALETLEKLGPDGVLHKVIFIGTGWLETALGSIEQSVNSIFNLC